MKTLDNLIDAHIAVQSGYHAGNNSVGDVCKAGEAIKDFHAQAVKDAEKRGLSKALKQVKCRHDIDGTVCDCCQDNHDRIDDLI